MNTLRITPKNNSPNCIAGAQDMSDPKHLPIDLEAFSWTYSQTTGELQQDGEHVATGYSGTGAGKNNPVMQNVPNVGPIPRGNWTITGPPADTRDHGPCVLRLEPAAETDTRGRSGFLIHGDSKAQPGTASHGCIILPRAVRELLWQSGDHDLEVRAEVSVEKRRVEPDE
jgi:type VI secretion system (T6SS) effector TldE1-like protein